jgi:hypothetical protein
MSDSKDAENEKIVYWMYSDIAGVCHMTMLSAFVITLLFDTHLGFPNQDNHLNITLVLRKE